MRNLKNLLSTWDAHWEILNFKEQEENWQSGMRFVRSEQTREYYWLFSAGIRIERHK